MIDIVLIARDTVVEKTDKILALLKQIKLWLNIEMVVFKRKVHK